jgi:hypothetical protein
MKKNGLEIGLSFSHSDDGDCRATVYMDGEEIGEVGTISKGLAKLPGFRDQWIELMTQGFQASLGDKCDELGLGRPILKPALAPERN